MGPPRLVSLILLCTELVWLTWVKILIKVYNKLHVGLTTSDKTQCRICTKVLESMLSLWIFLHWLYYWNNNKVYCIYSVCLIDFIWYSVAENLSDYVEEKLYDLEDHTDGEANPDAHRAADGGDEGGQGVARRLRDGLHVQGHEVNLRNVYWVLLKRRFMCYLDSETCLAAFSVQHCRGDLKHKQWQHKLVQKSISPISRSQVHDTVANSRKSSSLCRTQLRS